MKSSGTYRVLTLAAGIATACLIVFSQLFYFQVATYCQKKAESVQQKNQPSPGKETGKTDPEAYISIPSNTISTVSNIQLSEGISFLLETLLEPKEETAAPETPHIANRLFQTLFRFIIASNAP